ncbi:MAG: diguanylate cyclase [Rhodopseudomonas sp.]|uniref:diguanylate cyclase domain-containing protein n=1 Tax=Rhodopseudomonas sp. TaxID=1078 RepID=UPI0017A67402|nr:diguanylate cyclase [Rhodopseudomonas sp.]NVN86142.1 diguanylate cyclase [Rhodopseudomonas sp.]
MPQVFLSTEHDPRLVALAIATSLWAAIVSIALFKRCLATQGRPRLIWLGLSAVSGGYGIWTTHVIALLASDSPAAAADDLGLMLLTLAVAVLATGAGLWIALSNGRTQIQLRQQKLLLDTAIENMPQALCMFDAEGCITLFNARYAAMIGIPATTLLGMSLRDQLKRLQGLGEFAEDPDQFSATVMAEMRGGHPAIREITAAGRVLRVTEQPLPGHGWVATLEDVTEWREAQEQIAHLALHDPLTQLPNRAKFRHDLERVLNNALPVSRIAVLYLDLDHFKDINDTFGHSIGDALLNEVSQRLVHCVRSGDTVARLGGDEFAIVQVSTDAHAPAALAARIVRVIAAPYTIQGNHVVVGASVGIALSPGDGTAPDELLMKADTALYSAKAEGRGTYRFYEAGMKAHTLTRRVTDKELRKALLQVGIAQNQSIHDDMVA